MESDTKHHVIKRTFLGSFNLHYLGILADPLHVNKEVLKPIWMRLKTLQHWIAHLLKMTYNNLYTEQL